ncbi:MAG TPA: hypothetical protein VFA59_07150 [Vicinamibacterales bacterium]|nr:hypothetical protein [Vicinamibacterales bacterium]
MGSVGSLVLLLAMMTQSVADAPANDSASLRRIREKLAKPAPSLVVKAPTPEPTFKVEVQQHPYFTEIPFVWTFNGGGVPTTQKTTGPGQPLITVGVPIGGGEGGVLPALRALKSKLQERGAREEVERAIAEFCATHACL